MVLSPIFRVFRGILLSCWITGRYANTCFLMIIKQPGWPTKTTEKTDKLHWNERQTSLKWLANFTEMMAAPLCFVSLIPFFSDSDLYGFSGMELRADNLLSAIFSEKLLAFHRNTKKSYYEENTRKLPQTKMRPRLTPEPHNNTNTKLRDLCHRYKSKYDKRD